MYSVGSAYADMNKAQYLKSIVDLKRFIQSARSIEINFSHSNYDVLNQSNSIKEDNKVNIQNASEEILRKKILKITGSSQCNLFVHRNDQHLYDIHLSMWLYCVNVGSLCDASLILNRHINTANVCNNSIKFNSQLVITAFKSIPLSTPIEKIVVWLKADIIPKLYQLNNLSSICDDKDTFSIENCPITSLLADELNKRAYLSATDLNQPFQAIMVILHK
jgi:hypothetical protein